MAIAQFSGLASGIDSASLIDAIISARETQNQLRRNDIDDLQAENSSLDELNTKLIALNDLIDRFRTSNGGGVNKRANSTTPTVATATASSSAANASYGVTVSSIAKAGTTSFNNSYASGSAAVSAGTGNLSISVGEGPDLINITAAIQGGVTTLDQLADAINADPNASGRLVASVVNLSTGSDYRLILTSLQTGTGRGRIATSADPALTEIQTADTTIDDATDAIFQLSGITGNIIRPNNSISDVVSGLSFNLTGTGTTNISVASDVDTTSDKMQEIIDAYNDVVQFINENDAVTRTGSDDAATNVFGSLAKTRIDDDFLSSFRTQVLGAESDGTRVTSLSELGFITNRDGTITFDSDQFKENAAADPDGASGVLTDFADNVAGVGGVIYQFTSFGGFIDIAKGGNNSEIEDLNRQIQQLERYTGKIRDSLTKQFARLESITSELQSKQQALTSVLAGL